MPPSLCIFSQLWGLSLTSAGGAHPVRPVAAPLAVWRRRACRGDRPEVFRRQGHVIGLERLEEFDHTLGLGAGAGA